MNGEGFENTDSVGPILQMSKSRVWAQTGHNALLCSYSASANSANVEECGVS